jgi:hypothetical protein
MTTHAPDRPSRPGGNDAPTAPVVAYRPGQVCCVIRIDAPESEVSQRVRRLIYTTLIEEINRLAPELATRYATTGDDAFDADLAPERLRALLERDPSQPILRQLPMLGRSELPWVLLGRIRRPQDSTLHCGFQVGPEDAEPADRVAYVREMVNLLNRHAGAIDERLAGAGLPVGGLRLRAASPNWLGSAAPEPHTGAGPGVPPSPAPRPAADAWRFRFPGHPELEAATDPVAARHEAGIMVAVLDTSPSAEDVAAAAARFPDNPLLAEVRDTVVIDEALSPVPPHTPPAGTAAVYPNWRSADNPGGVDADALRIADHGLFAAGIIRSILPTTPIHLIRVLDDHGVGDTLGLTQALGQVRDLADRAGRRLVVNLSLVTAIPTGEDFVRLWLPKTAEDPKLREARGGDIEVIRQAAQAGVTELVDWLAASGVLVVAAAGNDAAGEGGPGGASPRPEPRLPARCDTVLGVSATRRGGQSPAAYSNRADMFIMGDGIATFGGNRDHDDPPAIDTGRKSVDAILGIFSAEKLPEASGDRARRSANASGWVYWAGTSFATPIISAAAVRVWAQLLAAPPGPGSPTPGDVVIALRGKKQADLADLDAPVLAADQGH